MRNEFSGLFLHRLGPLIGFVLAIACMAACNRKDGEAIVLEKEHIAAAEISATPGGTPTVAPAAQPVTEEGKPIEMGADDITVDSYVMNKDLRGTSKDPRATDREQWLVKVRMVEGGRQFNVQAEPAQYERLKAGDRVRVRYREGRYTHTVWSAEIE
jgi:hypothetical protein